MQRIADCGCVCRLWRQSALVSGKFFEDSKETELFRLRKIRVVARTATLVFFKKVSKQGLGQRPKVFLFVERSSMTARSIACEVLTRCEKSGQYSNLALDAALRRGGLNESDRALATVLTYGVLERKLTLDHCISRLSARPLNQISPEVLNHLRIGLYQLAYLDRIPDHAAVNEAVSLAGKKAGGFVNAVLREFIRREKEIPLPDPSADRLKYLSVAYSVGTELCERLLNTFGEEKCESLLGAFGEHPPLTVRVNTLKTTREKLLNTLRDAGYQAEGTKRSRSGIRIYGNAAVTAMPGFADGEFFVQDEASQLCVEALDAGPGMRVLDTCACPGSKSFGAAINMKNEGELISCDLHASKLSLVTSGAKRLGIGILRTLERDARSENPEWNGTFDRVLCDVPCSGFGVIAKKPELRYKDPAVSDGLPDIQLAILRASAEYLRSGGKLIYSTCTIFPRENGENIRRFLCERPEFSLALEMPLFPDTDGTDGFYIAVLEKK